MKTAALLILLSGVTQLSMAERAAFVVGISNYPADGVLGDLPNPVNDAKLLAGTLKQTGFAVTLVTDATKGQLKGKLDDFVDSLQPGADAVVYFAGHGMQHEGKNYLLASNAKLVRKYDLGEESVEADTLLEALAGRKLGSALIFLDCCRTPPSSSWLASDKRSGLQPGLAAMQNTDLLIHYAAAPGKPALDGKGANSPYAAALAKHLLGGKELAEMLRDVANDVLKETGNEQRPFQTGSLLRPFHFLTAPAVCRVLAVGIDEYPRYESNLTGCVADARLFADTLTSRCGIPPDGIRLLVNREATKAGLVKAIKDHLLSAAKPEDVLVFYFAGNGFQAADRDGDEADKRDEALQPSDSDPIDPETWLLDDELAGLFGTAAAGRILIVLDSCKAGGFDLADFPPAVRPKAANWAILGGCAESEIVAEVSAEKLEALGLKRRAAGGAFTAALVEMIRQKPERTWKELEAAVGNTLKEWEKTAGLVRQTPRFVVPNSDVSLLQFLRGSGPAASAPPPK